MQYKETKIEYTDIAKGYIVKYDVTKGEITKQIMVSIFISNVIGTDELYYGTPTIVDNPNDWLTNEECDTLLADVKTLDFTKVNDLARIKKMACDIVNHYIEKERDEFQKYVIEDYFNISDINTNDDTLILDNFTNLDVIYVKLLKLKKALDNINLLI